jgi:subtilisin family serine protease
MKKRWKWCCSRYSHALSGSSLILFFRLVSFLLLLSSSWSRILTYDAEADVIPPHRADRILIRPNPPTARVSLQSLKGYRVLRNFAEIGWQVVEVPPGVKVLDALEQYRASGLASAAEPDYLLQGARSPNDPSYLNGTQWGLNNVGQDGGRSDADIDAPEGWEILYAGPKTTVAVIDTGVRYTHEDLAANMWTNAGEIPNNGIDDDSNGVVDDIHGFNSLARSGNPTDDNGHGTHVAGIIGAVGNNGKGMAGVAWNVRIMACKFLDANNRGALSDAIECIHYARKNGAQIINASWETATRSSALQSAITAARDAGIIVVAAAGNETQNLDLTPRYPACYTLDNIVAVASMTRLGALDASYSNYGQTSVDLAAPGVSIFSTGFASDTAYQYMSGTSMAAPHVTGALALMRSYYPNDSYKQLVTRLLLATDPIASLAGKTVSGGCVNLRKALGASEFGLSNVIKPASIQVLTQPDKGFFQVQLRGEPGKQYVLQVSTNFVHWTPFATNTVPMNGLLTVTDPSAANFRSRYYRATLP